MNKQSNAGFTLIEMMIVVEIIAILIAIALPQMLRQRIQTNESTTIQNLRTISTAQMTFNSANNRFGSFDELTAGSTDGLSFLSGVWTQNCVKNDYSYSIEDVTEDAYTAKAAPFRPGRSGIRTFTIDEGGTITMETVTP